MIKTIIIDDNKEVAESILDFFSSSNTTKIVNCFQSGKKALEYLKLNNDIDVVILDLVLPELDGLSVLEEIKISNINCKSIVLSTYTAESVINRCLNFGAAYYMAKPFSLYALEKRIIECVEDRKVYSKKINVVDAEISELLHNLGIPSHIRGYKYIRDGINILYNSESINLITKDIYPQIADKYDTTPSRVERAIRHAIEVSWIRGDLALMEEIFGFSVSCDKAKPTNSEFLSTIADRIKLGEQERTAA